MKLVSDSWWPVMRIEDNAQDVALSSITSEEFCWRFGQESSGLTLFLTFFPKLSRNRYRWHGCGVTFVPEKRDKPFCPLPRFFLRFATVGIIAAQNYSGKDAIEQLGLWVIDAIDRVTPQIEEVVEWHLFWEASLSNPKNSLAQRIQSCDSTFKVRKTSQFWQTN